MMHTRVDGGKFGAVSSSAWGAQGWPSGWPCGSATPDPRAPPDPRDPAPSPLHAHTAGGGVSGHQPGGAASSGVTPVLSLPKRQPQAPPRPPIPVTVPFSLQHERARGLRARRRHRLHQHQLAEVCGVEAGLSPRGGGSPQPPRSPSPSQLGLLGCTEPPPTTGVQPAPPAPALPNYSLPQHSRPRYFTYFSDPTILHPPHPPTPGL